MEQRSPPEFILDAFADPASVRDVVKGILHTIFFHRYFPALTPRTRPVLDLTLPYVDDVELETMIEQRTTALARQLESPDPQTAAAAATTTTITTTSSSTPTTPRHGYSASPGSGVGGGGGGGGRGQVSVHFFEKKRRKAWLVARGDDEVCWENWTVRVTVAEPRTESERAKVRRAMEQTLLTTVMKIVTYANAHKDHIPPITAQGSNPFPYQISLNQKENTGWATRIGIY